jgi:hypothetical protein
MAMVYIYTLPIALIDMILYRRLFFKSKAEKTNTLEFWLE